MTAMCDLWIMILLQWRFLQKSRCGDTPDPILTANVIISQSDAVQAKTILFVHGVSSDSTSHKRRGLQFHLIAQGNNCRVCMIGHNPASIWYVNLAGNTMLSRILTHSIWQYCCIIQSATGLNTSMTQLSLNLSNRYVTYSSPATDHSNYSSDALIGVMQITIWSDIYP